jgi:hypothetical protein
LCSIRGWVKTEMGNTGARLFGLEEAPGSVEESDKGVYNVVTAATREKYGGKVVLLTGEIQGW